MKDNVLFTCFIVLQRTTSNDETSGRGGQGAPYFRIYGRPLVLKTSDFVKEILGRANVVKSCSGSGPLAQV